MSTGIISSLDRSLPSPPRPAAAEIDHPDRRRDQSRQFRRPIVGQPCPDDRHEHGDRQQATDGEQNAGVGFAIPVNTIARIVPQLIQNGRVQRPDAGIVKVFQTDRGLLIVSMVPGGPAQRAGLQGPRIEEREQRQGPFVTKYRNVNWAAADLIVAVDGQPIKTAEDFLNVVEAKQPGQQVVITVIRAGQQIGCSVDSRLRRLKQRQRVIAPLITGSRLLTVSAIVCCRAGCRPGPIVLRFRQVRQPARPTTLIQDH